MAYTPYGEVGLTNRVDLQRSLAALPPHSAQAAVDWANAVYPGHSASPFLKLGVGTVLAAAGGQAFGALGDVVGISDLLPSIPSLSGGSGVGIFDGLPSWVTTAKDILQGVSSAASLFRPVADLAAPFVSYGATQDQLEQQYRMFQEQKAYGSEEAERAWLRSEASAGTAYQKAVKDLEAAGLNPMLAYRNGGAQAMSSSAPSTPAAPNIPSPGLNAISTALQVRGLQADVALKEAQAVKAQQDAKTSSAVEAVTRADVHRVEALTKEIGFRVERLLPAEEAKLISEKALNSVRYNLTLEQIKTEFQRIGLTKNQAAEALAVIEKLKSDVKWADVIHGSQGLRNFTSALEDIAASRRMDDLRNRRLPGRGGRIGGRGYD